MLVHACARTYMYACRVAWSLLLKDKNTFRINDAEH